MLLMDSGLPSEPRASSLARSGFAGVWESPLPRSICHFPEGWRPRSSGRMPTCFQFERSGVRHAPILNAGQPAARKARSPTGFSCAPRSGPSLWYPVSPLCSTGQMGIDALEQQAQLRHVCNKRMSPNSTMRLSSPGSIPQCLSTPMGIPRFRARLNNPRLGDSGSF